ncbi:MAG: 2-phospho-L-lactate guanylyltransferase [Pseudonocardia sp.]|nr:2-phospho-L-lactate guanylyltransferase [Pseudonocardia sp.]
MPVKPLHVAKSRLRGAADRGIGDPQAHARLALALALDTVAAARAAALVGEIVVVTSDPEVSAGVTALGAHVLADEPADGLNAALRRGAAWHHVRRAGRALATAGVAALQADLAALHPDELDAALAGAHVLFASGAASRAFCADAHGDGTTLLVAAPGVALDPRFGPGSAAAHRESGAVALTGAWTGLRLDVDTEADLREARAAGIGPRTGGLLDPQRDCRPA